MRISASRAAVAEYDQQQMKTLHEQVGIKPEDDGVTRLRKLFGAKPGKDAATPSTTAAPAP